MNALAYSRSYDLGCGHSVTFTLSNGAIECEWSPGPLKPGRKLLRAYRKARTDFLASLDLNVLVIEI